MNTNGNKYRVAIGLLELFDHLRALGTVHTALACEVFQQHHPLCRLWLDVDKPLTLINVTAGRSHQRHQQQEDMGLDLHRRQKL